MSTNPPQEIESSTMDPHSDSQSAAPNGATNRRASATQTNVVRRTDQARAVLVNTQTRKVATSKSGAKPRRPAVDEAEIIQWLGGSDLAAEPRPAQSAKTSASVSARTSATVPLSQSVSDDVILSRVAERLAEKNISSFARIGLDIKSGAITVRGTVSTKAERLLLMHVLRTTPGVRTVNDGLVIGTARSAGPKMGNLIGSISMPSMPSIPSMPDFSSLKEALSSVNPLHAGVLLASLGILGFLFFPRGTSNPVAVYPVKGRVFLEGKPLAEAIVVFHPVGNLKLPGGILPRGTTEADGGYVVKTFAAGDGSPEGEFVATVHLLKPTLIDGEMAPGPDIAPTRYRTPETSPFRFKITRELKEISLLELSQNGGTASANN